MGTLVKDWPTGLQLDSVILEGYPNLVIIHERFNVIMYRNSMSGYPTHMEEIGMDLYLAKLCIYDIGIW